jgi:chlorite dismutase
MTCHNYIFFKIEPLFAKLPATSQTTYKKEFLKELKKERNVTTYTYATVGLKANTNILLWFQAETIDEIQQFLNRLLHTKLGRYLQITYTLLGMTRPTQYSPKSTGHLDTNRKGGKYLVIYPFTKTQSWYTLAFDTRRNLMWGHVKIGKQYHKQIEQLLLYSYGVDDSEFIVSYEMDDLQVFQSLVIELRSDKVREYTLKDTPIFTCIYKKPEDALAFL